MNGQPSRDEFNAVKLLIEAVKAHVDDYEAFSKRTREHFHTRLQRMETLVDGLGPVLADLKIAVGALAENFSAIQAHIDPVSARAVGLGRPLTIAESKRITNHLCQDGRLREGSRGICPQCESYDDRQLIDPDPTRAQAITDTMRETYARTIERTPIIPVGNRESGRPCGCDPAAGWVCEDHRVS